MNIRSNKWKGILAGVGAELLLLGGIALADPAVGETEMNSPKGQTRTELIQTSARITGIDNPGRAVLLKSDDGSVNWVRVPESVKSFDKLKMGDHVDVDYYLSMAVGIEPKGSKATSASETEVGSIDKGAGVEARELKTSATVVSVDPSANTVTFKGPKGRIRTVHVQDSALQAKLPMLKPGQVVQFDYIEAVAADIRPASK
jgi:hypothetical protein